MKSPRSLLGLLAVAWAMGLGLPAGPARAEIVVLEASRDATLIESDAGELANGSGPALFVGRNNAPANSIRRALLAFDLAGAIPAGAWVIGVELELVVTPSNRTPIDLGLHGVLSPWSEGPSSASGGGGAAAEPGDVTWLHTHYDSHFWDEPGGDFTPTASAVTTVGEPGLYLWASTPSLVADVQGWVDDPQSNFGWIVMGGEELRQTAKSIASRESPDETSRPRLVVEYATRCDAFDLGPGALGLCRAYCEALDCAGPDPRGSDRACERLALRFERRTHGLALPCVPPGVGIGP